MFGANRRNTLGQTPGARANARTPTKPRITDFTASSSVKKGTNPDTGRLSLSQQGGQPRLSLFQKPSAVATRDVKALMPSNVKKIYQFLTANEGDDAPPESSIRNPNGRADFTNIFELIYQHLSKDYEIPQGCRLEEEIPQIFRALGYPTVLKNSFFNPMGAAHGYPHLLEALGWLVDTVNMSYVVAGVTQNILIGDFTEQSTGNGKLFKYSCITTTYKEYTTNRQMLRNPEFVQEKSQQFKRFLQNNDGIEEMCLEAQTLLEQLLYDCEELAADKGKEQQLKEDQARFKDDVRKATDYLTTVDAVYKSCERELEAHVAEMEEKRSEFNRISENVENLKRKVEEQKQTHGLSGDAVRKMNTEIRKDMEMLRERNEQHAELAKELWLIGEKDREAFKEQLTSFMQLVKTVGNISAGFNINMDPFIEPRNEDELQNELERMSKRWAPLMAQEFNRRKLEVETQLSRIQQKTETVTQRVQMVNEKLDEMKRIETREDRIRRKEKEEWKHERLQLENKIECLENELEVLNEKMHEAGSLEKQIEMEKEAFEKLKVQIAERTSKMQRIMKEKVDMIVAEMISSENKYMKMMKDCDELLETVQDLKV